MAMQYLLIFMFRVSISLEFQILYIYATELYPVQVSGLGISLFATVGNFSNIFLPKLISYLNKSNISIMFVFFIVTLLGIFSLFPLKETMDMLPKEKI
jgi:hypothetical protein